MRLVSSIVGLALVPSAWASSGPWVPGPGETQVFVGGDAQRFSNLKVTDENGDAVVIPVDEGISAVDLKGIASYGILGKFELEGSASLYHVYANREDGAVCNTVLGEGSCATTDSIGILTFRGKGLILDELAGAAISMALGAELRHGAFTARDRERVTNTGEGTFDAGAFLDVGRVGGIGSDGSWAAYLELGGRYRFPNTTSYLSVAGDEVSVPGNEWFGQLDFLVSPRFPVAFGPEIAGLWRPAGLAWYEANLADEDRFGALKVALVRAGGKVIVRNRLGTSFVVSALGTVFAWNNPSDVFLVSMGVGFPVGKKAS
jgi:hypothetical protein